MFQIKFIPYFMMKIGVLILAFLAPIAIFIHSIIFLTIVDLITAIIRDKKIKRYEGISGRVIESRKLRKTVTKIIMYILFIISSYILMIVTFNSTFFIPNIVFGLLSMVEVVSIGENMSFITDNNVFVGITKKVSKFFTKKIDKTFE